MPLVLRAEPHLEPGYLLVGARDLDSQMNGRQRLVGNQDALPEDFGLALPRSFEQRREGCRPGFRASTQDALSQNRGNDEFKKR